ncbi:16098_t:CDS:2, partial [Racocetra fulgida]
DQVNVDYIEDAREDNYEITKICLADILSTIEQDQIIEIWRVVISCGSKNNYVVLLAKWHIGLIAARWYKDNFTDIWQQPPITICANSDQVQGQGGVEYPMYKFDYIKQVRSAEVYSEALKEVNNTRQKYDIMTDDIECNIKNPVIST